MKIISIYAIAFVLVLQSCAKDGNSLTYVFVKNTTNHVVKIKTYWGGALLTDKSFTLSGNNQHQIDYNSTRGKSASPLALSSFFQNVDSVQIVWDDTYVMTHMIADSFTSSGNYISFFNDKNIGKVTKYQQEKVGESSHSIEWNLFYNLTEQDYLDAKE